MKMLLTLLRHAKTEPARAEQEDWHRELQPRGRRDARDMGRRLHARDLKPALLVTSPAVRALETAKIVARELKIAQGKIRQDERLYLASAKVLLQVVQEQGQGAAHLMIVGHNPGITEFADRLSSERTLDNMPTCAAYTLEFDIASWSELAWGAGTDAEFDYPGR
jgi:phosphohistidine phosphatase